MQPNDPTPHKHDRATSNPQVVTAIITGLVTVVVAVVGIVPQLVNNNASVPISTPTVAPTVIVVTSTPPPTATDLPPTEVPPSATPIPPTATQNTEPSPSPLPIIPTTEPTLTPLQLTPNVIPTEAVAAQPITVASQPTKVIEPPTAEAAAVAPPPANPPNARLLFDSVSLTLINESGRTLSLVGVTFSSAVGSWEARVWGGRVHDRLPDGLCLRLREAAAGQRTPPAQCVNKIFGLIEAGGTAMFWRGVDSFNVLRNGEVIATCQTAAGECALYIPQG